MRNALRKRIFKGMMVCVTPMLMGRFGGNVAVAQDPTWTFNNLDSVCAAFASKFGPTRTLDYNFVNVYEKQAIFSATYAPHTEGCVYSLDKISIRVHRIERSTPFIRPRIDWQFNLARVAGDQFKMTGVVTNCEGQMQMHAVKGYVDSGVIVSPDFAEDIVRNAREQQCPALQKAVWEAIIDATRP